MSKEKISDKFIIGAILLVLFLSIATFADSQSCANKKESCSAKPCCSGLECNNEAKVCMPLSQSGSCSADKTTIGQKVCGYDNSPKNSIIDDAEILKAIDDWIKNRAPYLTDSEIIALMDMWIKQCDFSGVCVSGVTTTTTAKPYVTTTTTTLKGTTTTAKTTTTINPYYTTTTYYYAKTTTTIKPYGTTTTTVADDCYTAFTKTNKKACNYDFDSDGIIEDGSEINSALTDSSKGKLTSSELDGIMALWKRSCIITNYCRGTATTTTTIKTNTCEEKFGYDALYKKCPSEGKYKSILKTALNMYLNPSTTGQNELSLVEMKDLIKTYILEEDLETADCSALGDYSDKPTSSLIGKVQVLSGALNADFECDRYIINVGGTTTCKATHPENLCSWEVSQEGEIIGSKTGSSVSIKAKSEGNIEVKLTTCGYGEFYDTREKVIKAQYEGKCPSECTKYEEYEHKCKDLYTAMTCRYDEEKRCYRWFEFPCGGNNKNSVCIDGECEFKDCKETIDVKLSEFVDRVVFYISDPCLKIYELSITDTEGKVRYHKKDTPKSKEIAQLFVEVKTYGWPSGVYLYNFVFTRGSDIEQKKSGKFVVMPEPVCDGKKKDKYEECDGSDLGGETCETLNKGKGVLKCSDCKFDFSDCVIKDDSYKIAFFVVGTADNSMVDDDINGFMKTLKSEFPGKSFESIVFYTEECRLRMKMTLVRL